MSMFSSLALVSFVYVVGLFASLYCANWFFEPEYHHEKKDLFLKCVFWPGTIPFYFVIILICGLLWILSRPFSWLEDWFYALPKPKKEFKDVPSQ
jgi:hypothetical protein